MKRIGHAAVMQAHGDVARVLEGMTLSNDPVTTSRKAPVMHGTHTALQLQCCNDTYNAKQYGAGRWVSAA